MAENNNNESFNDFYRNYLNENANAGVDKAPSVDSSVAPASSQTLASTPTSSLANIATPETATPNAKPTVTSALAASTFSSSGSPSTSLQTPTSDLTSATATSASGAAKPLTSALASTATPEAVKENPSAQVPPATSALSEIAKGNNSVATPSSASTTSAQLNPTSTPVTNPTTFTPPTLAPTQERATVLSPGISPTASSIKPEQVDLKPEASTPESAKSDGWTTSDTPVSLAEQAKEPKPKADKQTPSVFYTVAVILITILLSFVTVFVSAKFGLLNGLVNSNVASDYNANQANRAYQKDDANPSWEKIFADVNPSVVSIQIIVGQGQELGSGFIYNADGTVITNNHVVTDAATDKTGKATISVTLSDGRIYNAEIVGRDELTDLAVIKLKNAPEGLTPMQFDDSDAVTVGDRVMAVGNPLGLANTATTGIVSALDRPVSAGDSATSGSVVVSNSIQIDAAINPGNSGGPLFDASAKVIGVNSSIAQTSSNSGSIGLGFAIPSNTARQIVDTLIKDGSVKHAALGVSAQSAQVQFDGSDHRATQIVQVGKDSPAEKAGIQKDDYIVGLNSKPVISNLSLIGFINALPLDSEITLNIIRDGKKQDIKVKLDKERESALSGLSSDSSQQQTTPTDPNSDGFDPFEELER